MANTKTNKAVAKSEISSVVGKNIPAFELPITGDETISSENLKGKKYVLYYYPKDNTPGCTLEGQDFAKLYKHFQKLNTEVIGVSRDSVECHEGFKKKFKFPFALMTDAEDFLARKLGVIQMKNNYGKTYEGIVRSTFVINEKGKILQEWRKVKVEGHAEEVLEFVKGMES